MLGRFTCGISTKPSFSQQCRLLRTRWERGYLKDLYHRRQLLGADPEIIRSAMPNWSYAAEISAFGHRIGAPELSQEALVQAFTCDTFLTRPDVEELASRPSPSNDDTTSLDVNVEKAAKGKARLDRLVLSYLRFHLPQAPEELIEATCAQLTSKQLLAEVAKCLGVDTLVRCGESRASNDSLATCFRALVGTVDEAKAKAVVVDFIVPQLIDVDFAEIYPLTNPLDVLRDLIGKQCGQEIEPRIIRSAGVVSAQPVYVVGIFKGKEEIIGQSAGESLEIAVDLAAREGLLRLWGITSDRVFFFGDRAQNVSLSEFEKPNYRLRDVCAATTNTATSSVEEEPLNIIEIALRYQNEIENTVGRSYTKRLRHKFSRGSLAKRSFRYLVKPKVYTVS